MNDNDCVSTTAVEYEEAGPRYSASYLAKVGRFQQSAIVNRYSENSLSQSYETTDDDLEYDRSVYVAPSRDFVEEDDKETENITVPDRLCQPESPTVVCCVNNLDFNDGDIVDVLECQPATDMYFKSRSNSTKMVTLERQTSEETELTFGSLSPMNKMNHEMKETSTMQNRSRNQISGWAKLFSTTIQRSKSAISQDLSPMAQKNSKMRSGRKSEQSSVNVINSTNQDTNGLDMFASKSEMRKKKRSIGVDMREKLGFFRKPTVDAATIISNPKTNVASSSCLPRLDNVWRSTGGPPTREQISSWSRSFEDLLFDKHGISLFLDFLRSEFSEENLEFWSECQRYRSIVCPKKLQEAATQIYEDYVAEQSPKEINIDSVTRIQTSLDICNATSTTFDQSQKKIQALMEKDSYQRFLRSDIYSSLIVATQLNQAHSNLFGKFSPANSGPVDRDQSRVSFIPGLLPNVKAGTNRARHTMMYTDDQRLFTVNVSRPLRVADIPPDKGLPRSAPSSPKDTVASTIPY